MLFDFWVNGDMPGVDCDGDGVTNQNGLDTFPFNANIFLDTDGDGLPDGYELLEGTNPNEPKSRLKSFIDIRDEEVRVGTLAVATAVTSLAPCLAIPSAS